MTETSEVRQALPGMLKRLRAHAYKLTRNRADADDLTQETCVKALSRGHQYHEGTELWGWLATIMRTTWIDMVRHKQVVTNNHTRCPGLLLPTYVMPACTNAAIANVERGLAKLDAEHSEILMIMYIEGNTQQEAAKIIGIPLGTVQSRATRARRKLAALLEGA